MKHNMNRVLSVIGLLMMVIGTWAAQTVTIVYKSTPHGGTVLASSAAAGETCTLTVTPTDGYSLKSLKAVTTLNGDALQAPKRTISISEGTELTITSDSNADPSGVTTHTFTMPASQFNVEVTAEFATLISISDAVITLAETSFTYDGTEKKPAVSSVVVGGTPLNTNEFTVSYSNNTNVSAAATPTVTVTGQRSYTGTATTTFTISPKSITSDMITLSSESFEYSGVKQIPNVTVKDKINNEDYQLVGDDYDLSYQLVNAGENPVNIQESEVVDVATYNVVVAGKGNYTGSVSKSF